MPAGTSWPRYILAVSAMMLSMFAGSQTVHLFYQPLQDFDSKVAAERQKLNTWMEENAKIDKSDSAVSSSSTR